ncbi:MAG: (2Fe-2S)-binding protein [Actinomycetota bacterium]|nr:MAG: (2Fe-2S)-binding protein [Actinomycetota bacterium]
MALVRACSVGEVPVGGALRVRVHDREIAIVNLGEQGFRAVDAVCSHAHAYLDEGEVDLDEGAIECPKHGSTFDLDTGRPLTLPATRPVRVFEVKVDDDDVLIEVNEG